MLQKILQISSYPLKFNKKLLKFNMFSYFQTKLTDVKLEELKKQYIKNPSLQLFQSHVQTSSDYFKIFRTIHSAPYSESVYQEFNNKIKTIRPQSDNLILLRTKILSGIAQNYQKNRNFQEAQKYYNLALDCMEQSMVPQILVYYTLYRKYGLFLAQVKKMEEAKQVLKESILILDQFVSNSEDPVSTSFNSLKQAQGAMFLYQFDSQEKEKWLSLANKQWTKCQEDKYNYYQYGATVIANIKNSITQNPQSKNKMKLYGQVQLQKMATCSRFAQLRSALDLI